MFLGAWMFATAVLLLVVLNAPFRKFFLRAVVAVLAILVTILVALAGGIWWARDAHQKRVEAKQQAAEEAAAARIQKLRADCYARFDAANVNLSADDKAFVRLACDDDYNAVPLDLSRSRSEEQ